LKNNFVQRSLQEIEADKLGIVGNILVSKKYLKKKIETNLFGNFFYLK